jgi:2-polyprenyl-3-methyl-5-hydroxy-6-metoxy-1,4-benzoquinol methylase
MVDDDASQPGVELTWRHAMGRVVGSLPLVERAYATVRFSILRPKLLLILDLLLPIEGRILDVGCGFGLFAGYFGQTAPKRSIIGIDPDVRRVAIARHVARQVGLSRHEFHVGDVRTADLRGPFDGIYILDVMHHIAARDQEDVLRKLHDKLSPGGRLVMKDVTTVPRSGLIFTEVLDRLMVGMNAEIAYRHHREWQRMLEGIGFRVRTVRVPDVLPYPHIVLSAEKR